MMKKKFNIYIYFSDIIYRLITFNFQTKLYCISVYCDFYGTNKIISSLTYLIPIIVQK